MIRGVIVFLIVLAVAVWGYYGWVKLRPEKPPIKVGILHSTTGTMAISEKSMVDAELLAIEELNHKGGLLGRRIEPVVCDYQSDWPTAAKKAEKLIQDDKVSTVFGCWTSASRKSVKPVFEKYDHLLIYPMAYEGLEQSPNIIYVGAAPNQQIIPAIKWAFDHLGKRFFLVGSDYVWPHCVNEIAKDQIKALGGEVVGEAYLLLDSSEVGGLIEQIKAAKPNVIFSSVVGESNVAFYRGLVNAGIKPGEMPVFSVSIAEDELRRLPIKDMVGNYCAWNYFQSLDRPENKAFVERFQAKYGRDRVTSDVIEAAYISVLLWAQGVQTADSDDVQAIRHAILGHDLNAPEGLVSVDRETQHTWRPVNIGKIRPDGQFEIIWSSHKSIRPQPFPLSRSRSDWEAYLKSLYEGWGGAWSNPGKK